MHAIHIATLACFILIIVEGFPSSPSPRSVFSGQNKVRPRFRRRELVQEEVRKTMLSYMTSLKGEITDVVLEEMIDYYNSQTSKLYRLEKELVSLKNSSLPILHNGTTINDLVQRISKQQRSFALNISSMEYKIKNLTNILNDLLNELQKPVQHVRRLVSVKKDFEDNQTPTGKLLIFLLQINKVSFNYHIIYLRQYTYTYILCNNRYQKYEFVITFPEAYLSTYVLLIGKQRITLFLFFSSIDCDDILRQQPSVVSQGIFRIKPRLSSESFDVQCIFENNTGKKRILKKRKTIRKFLFLSISMDSYTTKN
jgi:hypothetical protein